MSTVHRSTAIACGALALLLGAGCAATVSNELVDARLAFDHASHSPAARFAPAGLARARAALAGAEQAFLDEPRARRSFDLAYVACREAQLAETLAPPTVEDR